jgi:hypothetical protein
LIGDYQAKQKTVLQTIRVLTAETQFKVNEAIELVLNKVVRIRVYKEDGNN